MADDFNDWIDGEPITGPISDGSFTEWIDGEPVVLYADSATDLVIAAADHLHVADAADLTTFWQTDFSEYTTGGAPDGNAWPEELNTGIGTHIVRADGDLGGKCLELANSAAGRYFCSYGAAGSLTDVEVLAKVRITAAYDHTGRIAIRGSGGATSEQVYFCGIQPGADSVFIHKYTPVSTSVGSASKTIDQDTWYWIRFQAIGTALKLRVWEDGTSEPGTWDVSQTDSSLSSGWVGAGSYDTGADIDYFACSNDGSTVPMPFTATALVIPDAYHLHDADQADAFIGIVVWSGTHADAGTATMRSYRGAMIDTDISDPGITVTKIRVRYADTTVFTYGITGASIGLRDGTTSDYQTDKFTRLTFNGGSNTVTVGAGGGDKWSDWVDIDWFDDDTYTFVHTDLADVGGTFGIAYSSSGYTYRKDGTYSDAMVADISGYTLTGAYKYGYNRVEVAGVPSTDVNLVIPDAAHLHDADVLALTQAHDLVVAEAASLLVDEGPISLQTGLTLVLAESHHDLVDDGPLALTQAHALAVADCDHLHDADSIVLTALHILTVAECYHVHAPPNLALILPLTVQESDHLHDADNLTLSGDITLSDLDSHHVLDDDFDYLRSPDRTLVLVENGASSSGGIGYSSGTYRMPFNVAAAFPQHQKIRFQISPHATYSNSTLVSASYGYRASGDTTTDTPVALTFTGKSLPYTMAAGETFWSDWFDFSPGTSSEILVSLWFDDTHYPGYWSDGRTRYWGQGASGDQTLVVNMSTFLTNSNTWYVRSIEVSEAALAISDGVHATTSDNIDFDQHFLTTAESYHELTSQLGLATPLTTADAGHLHTADNLALGVHLTVADAVHLHEADAIPAMTGTHIISLDPGDHLHDAEALTLTQDHTLSLDDADHLHDADTLNLSGTNVLVVAEAYHVHAADSADLIVSLAVDEAHHLHTAPNLTLVSGVDLVIEDGVILTEADAIVLGLTLTTAGGVHLHAADTLALTGTHNLAVDEAWHFHEGEKPDIYMAGDLPISSAFSELVSDELALGGTAYLVVADAAHLQAVDGPLALTQDHYLDMGVDYLYHLHTADNVVIAALPADFEATWLTSATRIRHIYGVTTTTFIDAVDARSLATVTTTAAINSDTDFRRVA